MMVIFHHSECPPYWNYCVIKLARQDLRDFDVGSDSDNRVFLVGFTIHTTVLDFDNCVNSKDVYEKVMLLSERKV